MELVYIMLSEVTQSKKNTHGIHPLLKSSEYPRYKSLKEGNTETKCGAETEGKIIQRLPHLDIHSIYRHQIQTILQVPIAC